MHEEPVDPTTGSTPAAPGSTARTDGPGGGTANGPEGETANGLPAEDLAERLRAYLTSRVMEPGDRLPAERALADRFGVSRPTLRRALQRLADDGLIEIRDRSGAYLRRINLGELLAVRLRLEPYAAGLAASAATAGQRRQLRKTIETARASLDRAVDFAAADRAVHDLVAEACGNRVLAETLAGLRRAAAYSRRSTSDDPALRRRSLIQLETLISAIDAGDPGAAEQAMTEHLRDVGAVLRHVGAAATDLDGRPSGQAHPDSGTWAR